MSWHFQPGGECCKVDGLQAEAPTDIFDRLLQSKALFVLGKVSPEVQLDRCVGRDLVNCTDRQRSDVAIPGVPLAEQVEAGSCDLCVALGGE